MASYLPPTEELPIFDNQVFDTVNNTALTYAEAKKYFVSYPIAQGTATITDFIAGSISYLSPASGSFFNIGTNQVSGGTIRIGPTGSSTGVSVHAGNMDFTNNTINNATASDTGNIAVGNLQTSGILNIGTGVRITGSAINIGSNGNAGNIAPINIGCPTNTTTIGGPLTSTGLITASNGLTMSGAKGITLTSSSYTPTAGQLGYVISGSTISGFTNATSTNTTSVMSVSLTTGTWIVTATRQFVGRSLMTGAWFGLGQTLKNNEAFASGDTEFGVVTPSFINDVGTYANITGIVVLTAPTIIYLNYNVTYTGTQPTVGGTFPSMKGIRIG